jgi:hypothetical protein
LFCFVFSDLLLAVLNSFVPLLLSVALLQQDTVPDWDTEERE